MIFSELQKCGDAKEITEITARCGLGNSTGALPSDRKVKGKVGYFKKSKLVKLAPPYNKMKVWYNFCINDRINIDQIFLRLFESTNCFYCKSYIMYPNS